MSLLGFVLTVSLVMLAGAAGPILAGGRWPISHPGSAIVAWTATLTGIAGTLAGILVRALFWPPAPGHSLLELLDRCRHGHAGAALATVITLPMVAFVVVRLGRGVPRVWRRVRRRRAHQEMLALVATEAEHHADVLVIDHPVPVAYCMPSRHRRRIVVSAGVLDRLDDSQLGAVLAHERTHLVQRHHLLLTVVDLAYVAFPWFPTVRLARRRLPLLLELAADDGAMRQWGRRPLREALGQLAILPGPAGALSARGEDGPLALRLARLTGGVEAPRRGARFLVWTASTAAVAGPLALAVMAIIEVPLPC